MTTMNKLLSAITTLSLVAATANAGPVELTLENFEDKLAGKNGFVKMFAPWCGHCKSIKPFWDQLGDEYEASSSVLIGDADCTEGGKDLCEKFGVQGYPTLKYFSDGNMSGEDYQGGRDYDSLKKFIVDKLEVKCNVNDPTECTEKEKGFIEKMKAATAEERVKQLQRLEKMKGNSMKLELKQWLNQRLNILRSLDKGNEEL